MPATYLPQKTRYRITLDLNVIDDFNPMDIDWEKLLGIEGGESVEVYVEDLSTPDYYFS